MYFQPMSPISCVKCLGLCKLPASFPSGWSLLAFKLCPGFKRDVQMCPKDMQMCPLHTCLWQPGRSQEDWIERAGRSPSGPGSGEGLGRPWVAGPGRVWVGGWLAESGNGPASVRCVFRLFTAFP